jgi:hypothetical protein
MAHRTPPPPHFRHGLRGMQTLALLVTALASTVLGAGETRNGDCEDFNPERNAYYGDLHVHTALSMDAAQAGTVGGPDRAYRFAKGEAIELPPYDEKGRSTNVLQLERPLDFAAVTDHSEFLAETDLCFNKNNLLYFGAYCKIMRGTQSGTSSIDSIAFALGLGGLSLPGGKTSLSMCDIFPRLCDQRRRDSWAKVRKAANDHDDKSARCRFTTFVGYEWTGSPLLNNQHRNVIFRDDRVMDLPVSYYDAAKPERLWSKLDAGCTRGIPGCEVLAIPHNSNLGGGTMFNPQTEGKNPYTPALAAQRERLEPLVEIFQHKGASECINNAHAPLASQDELCNFELVVSNICTGSPDDAPGCKPLCSATARIGGFSGLCVEPSDFVRGALQTGLLEKRRTGANPFRLGIIASTDTHNATPGAVEEYQFPGHQGENDGDLASRIGIAAKARTPAAKAIGSIASFGTMKHYGPGGLAVVWAEQRTRDAIFDAMQRRETYATSGPRITTRFFGGHLPESLCDNQTLVKTAYSQGVPMGGQLDAAAFRRHPPRFVVSAMMDPGTAAHPGTPLQRIQIIKGWERDGQTFEKVHEVAGDPANAASVDTASCAPQGTGFASLCQVWTDPEFNAEDNAFYYARVVENPTCHWSRLQCNAEMNRRNIDCSNISKDDPLAGCCDGSLPDTVQERTWTSPIWLNATTGGQP